MQQLSGLASAANIRFEISWLNDGLLNIVVSLD